MIPRSFKIRRAAAGTEAQKSAVVPSAWQTNTPPFASPASGSARWKTRGSGDRTTSTYFNSPFSRIGSGAKTAKNVVGWPFFSDPYFGFAFTCRPSIS